MASDGMMTVFKQGAWQNGLFDIKCPDCLKHICCHPCSAMAIHKDVGSPWGNDIFAGLISCCVPGGAAFQIFWFGQKKKGPLEPVPIGILKTWCCGSCYLHQQVKELGDCDVIDIAKKMGKPSQEEMS
mmetsp:Transcript_32506/g.65702  ORF Transcript_32506/g.65702 Transcript_32506/m.65702 type:complete len:128 (-) Transcript_32506:311-694(-)